MLARVARLDSALMKWTLTLASRLGTLELQLVASFHLAAHSTAPRPGQLTHARYLLLTDPSPPTRSPRLSTRVPVHNTLYTQYRNSITPSTARVRAHLIPIDMYFRSSVPSVPPSASRPSPPSSPADQDIPPLQLRLHLLVQPFGKRERRLASRPWIMREAMQRQRGTGLGSAGSPPDAARPAGARAAQTTPQRR